MKIKEIKLILFKPKSKLSHLKGL